MGRKGKNEDTEAPTPGEHPMPKGWRTVRFDEIAESVADRVQPGDAAAEGVEYYVGLEHLDSESLKIRRWGGPDDVIGQKLRFRKGDIIFGRRRCYQRKLAVAEFDGICSAHAMVLRAKEHVVEKDFLPFFLQSDVFMDRALAISVGSLSPTINWRTLKVQEFPLPPRDEQRRIADILWAAEDLRDGLVLSASDVDALEAVLATHHMRSTDRHARAEGRSSVEAAWPSTPLGETAEVSYGITLNSSRGSLDYQRPYLRVANVQRGELGLQEVKLIGCTDSEAARYELQYGDVLVVEGHADANEVGRAVVYHSQIPGCLHQNHLIRVRCSNNLRPEFLEAFLNSPCGRLRFRRFAKSTSGLYTINSTVVRKVTVPMPPMAAQDRIVDQLDSIRRARTELLSHVEAAAALLIRLRSALIHNGK